MKHLSFLDLCPRFSPMEAPVATIYVSFEGLCLSIEISQGIDATNGEPVALLPLGEVTFDPYSNKMHGQIVALRPWKATEEGSKSKPNRSNIKNEASNVTLDLSM